MTGVFAAEWLKLRKRPATWIIAIIWFAFVLLVEYVLIYQSFKSVPRLRNGAQPVDRAATLALFLPQNIVHFFVPFSVGLGGSLVLVLSALIGGSEYGWSTLKTILTQRPDRFSVLAGKLLALALLLAIFVALGFVAAGLGSLTDALIQGSAIVWPSLEDITKGAGAMLFVFAAWAALGLGLAVLFRGTALAIGLGLVYAFVIQGLIGGLAASNDIIKTISKGLIGTNASGLVAPFLPSSGAFSTGVSALVGVGQAAVTLTIYIVVFVLLAALLLRRRDVT